MKRLEHVLLIVFTTAFILNLAGVSGVEGLLTVSCCILSFTYVFIGIANLPKLAMGIPIIQTKGFKQLPENLIFSNLGWKQTIATFFCCICFSISLLAILFRAQYVQGSSYLLIISIVLLLPPFIIAVIKRRKTTSIFYRQILIRVSGFILVNTILLLLSPSFIIDIKYRNQPVKLEHIKHTQPQ